MNVGALSERRQSAVDIDADTQCLQPGVDADAIQIAGNLARGREPAARLDIHQGRIVDEARKSRGIRDLDRIVRIDGRLSLRAVELALERALHSGKVADPGLANFEIAIQDSEIDGEVLRRGAGDDQILDRRLDIRIKAVEKGQRLHGPTRRFRLCGLLLCRLCRRRTRRRRHPAPPQSAHPVPECSRPD